jgi:hypothetical protein
VRRCWFFNPAYEVSRRTPSESISSRFNNARGANPARAVETAPAAARLASGEFPKEEEDRRGRARQRLHVRKRAKSCDGAIVRFSRTDNTVLKLTPVLKKHKYTVWRSSPYMYNSRAADHT